MDRSIESPLTSAKSYLVQLASGPVMLRKRKKKDESAHSLGLLNYSIVVRLFREVMNT